MSNFIFDQGLHFVDKLVVLHCGINIMEEVVNLYIHHGRTWVLEPSLSYVRGKVLIVEDFEIDHLNILHLSTICTKSS